MHEYREQLRKRAQEAQRRIAEGMSALRIPSDPTDPDIVIFDLLRELDRDAQAVATLLRIGDVLRARLPLDRQMLYGQALASMDVTIDVELARAATIENELAELKRKAGG